MSNGFNLNKAVERYAARIAGGVCSPRKRNRIKEEYAEHILDMVNEYQLGGMNEKEAFSRACEELGDESKMQGLLAAVHNKDRLPSWLRAPACLLGVIALVVSYLGIDNNTYRAWLLLLFQLALGVLIIVAACWAWRFAVCINIRRRSYKRIKKYANDNGFLLVKNCNVYVSLVKKTDVPELVLENDTQRYIINLWATLPKKKTLRLFDNGLYSYSDNVGYYVLFTQSGGFFSSNWWNFMPKGMRYFSTWHSDVAELPRGMHLMPKIEWGKYETPHKENVRVLMLNPIPFGCFGIEKGRSMKLGDDMRFCDLRVWSASGFLSYLEGLRISGKT